MSPRDSDSDAPGLGRLQAGLRWPGAATHQRRMTKEQKETAVAAGFWPSRLRTRPELNSPGLHWHWQVRAHRDANAAAVY